MHPNNDLGTAHGRIRIDFEDRGSSQAEAAVIRFERELKILNQKLTDVGKSFDRQSVAATKVSRDYRSAESSSRSFAASLLGIDRITKILDKDIIDLSQDIVHLNKRLNETKTKYKPLIDIYKVLDRYQSNLSPEIPVDKLNRALSKLKFDGLANGERKARSFYNALDSIGLGLRALKESSWKKLYGHKDAMQSLPIWSRYLYDFSVSMAKVGVAGMALSKALHTGFLTKFLDTNVFKNIVVRTTLAGVAMEKFGLKIRSALGTTNILGGSWIRPFSRLSSSLKNSEQNLSDFVKKVSHNANGASRAFNSWFTPIKDSARHIEKFVLGVGLMGSAVSNIASKFAWVAKIPKPILSALGVVISSVLPAAFQVLAKSLTFTSNTFAGLWVGIKQLSSGLLVLPGLIANIGVVAGTIKTIFGGLGDQLKDIFSADPKKSTEALAALPDHLKPLGYALKGVADNFRTMQTNIQKIAFKDIEKDIEQLGQDYFPLLERGISNVTLSLRGVKDEFVNFFKQARTQKDVSSIFNNTAQTIGALKSSIMPLGDAFRGIAVVGTQFIAELASSMEGLSQKFAAWVQVNRQSGQLMEWMRGAREGVRDLAFGTQDLVKGLWTILTMFKTNTGQNFLDTYAKSMEKFKEKMNTSAKSGFIFDFSDAVKGFAEGSGKIDVFKDVMQSLMGLLKAITPVIQEVSNSFADVFVPAIKWAMSEIAVFNKVVHELNLDSVSGVILGLVASFKLLPSVLGPSWSAIKGIGGAFLALRSAKGVVDTFTLGTVKMAEYLGKIPIFGGKAAKSLTNVADSVSGVVEKFAGFVGPVTAAIAVIVAMALAIKGANDDFKEFNNQLETNQEHANKAAKALNDAFLANNGKVGKTVMDQLATNMSEKMHDLEDVAAKGPGIIDQIGSWLSTDANNSNWYTRQSDSTNKWQKESQDAERASKKLKELRAANIDLEAVVSSSSDAYAKWIDQLRKSGDNGNEAADVIDEQRKVFELYYQSMSRLGPAGIQVANGIKKIAEASGDATTRLDGLKLALQGLGYLKVDALQAAADYTRTLGDLASQVTQAIASAGGDVSQAFNQIDGSINTSSQLGANLVSIFGQVSNAFLNTANSGGNIDEAFARLKEQIALIAPALGVTAKQLEDMLANSFGIVPEPIKILLQLEGKEPIARALGQFLVELDAKAKDNAVNVVLHFNSATEADSIDKEIEKILGRDITDVNGTDVVLKVGVAPPSPEELAKLQATLAQYGIKTTPGETVAPAQMPVAPIPTQVAPNIPGQTLPAPPAAPPPPLINAPAPNPYGMGGGEILPQPVNPQITMAPSGLDDTKRKLEDVDGKLVALASVEHPLNIDSSKLEDVDKKVDELTQKLSENKIKADIEVNGADKLDQTKDSAQGVIDKVNGLVTAFNDQVSAIVANIPKVVSSMADGVISQLDTLTESATTAGSKFVDAFADGMSNNPKAINAARALAEKVIAQYHQSPPKEGPLARHGDAASYAGKQFVSSYASGLTGSLPTAARAAGSVAGAAVGSLDGGGGKGAGQAAGQFLGQLLALTNFASSIVGVIQKVSDTVLGAFKFMSDPKGDGSFFGKRSYKKTVSDDELQKQLFDRQNAAYLSMKDGAQRDNTNFNNKLDIIKNAQNAVVDAKGYQSGETEKTIGAMIKASFPEIATIGGARPDSMPYHREGRALDIMIPNWDTKEGRALGDRINAWALQNAKKMGLEDTIWQDYWQPADGGQGNFLGRRNQGPTQAHLDHVHLTFAPGAKIDMTGIEMTADEQQRQKEAQDIQDKKTALQKLQDQYGPPVEPGARLDTPATTLQWDEASKSFIQVTPHGKKDLPSLGPINPETGQLWTDAERQQYIKDNPMQYTLPEGFTQAQMQQVANDPNQFSQSNQEEILKNLAATNSDVADALSIRDNPNNLPNISQERIGQLLEGLDHLLEANKSSDTAASRMQGGALEGLKSSVMGLTGFTQAGNPIDTVATVVSQATSMASDVINAVVTGIETVGAVKNITSTLVRGVSGTEDIYKNIDNVQKIFELFAGISGAVGSVAGLAGTIVGAAGAGDTSGGTQAAAMAINAIGMVAGFIQAGWEITNAVIDLGQEAYRIIGSYVGDFLGYLVGGPDGPLSGNVKFLLDQQTNQLLTYSSDNPFDKRTFDARGGAQNPDSRQQLIGNINVYGGPGSDPRDLTRQMMFQVNSAQYAGALAQ